MCIICKEWEMGKLTSQEALRNLGEIIGAEKDQDKLEHYWDVSDKIVEKEIGPQEVDSGLDEQWWNENHQED